jgi:uncharacterized Fe-S cluster-containing radical SAM superfamily protein
MYLCVRIFIDTTYVILNSSFKTLYQTAISISLDNFDRNYFHKIIYYLSDNLHNKLRFFTFIKMKDILQYCSAVILLSIRPHNKITRKKISHSFNIPEHINKIQHRIVCSCTTAQISNVSTISIFVLLVQLIYKLRRSCTDGSSF